jgi:hypothetical protein
MDDETESKDKVERNLGTQPLDALMLEREIGNHDLVATCTAPLTHKAVQRARKGRRLTKNTQRRVIDAFNALVKAKGDERVFKLEELFNYKA